MNPREALLRLNEDGYEVEDLLQQVAEVELSSETDLVEMPVWAIEEVTGQIKYFNSSLLTAPFSGWQDE